MLPGLLTTTMVTVLMCASVFQRRSRDGFVDELEMVRGEALTAPQGEVATAVAIADVAAAQDRVDGTGGEHEPEWHGWPGEEPYVDANEDIWAPPSPHPIRPEEMWHSSSAPAKFGASAADADDRLPVTTEEPAVKADDRLPATTEEPAVTAEVPHDTAVPYSDLPYASDIEPTPASPTETGTRRRFPRFRSAGAPDSAASGSATPGPEVPIIPTAGADGLLGGPVGRRDRNRGDRRPLPTSGPLRARAEQADDQSPLVDAPLPPAAPPAARPFEAAAVPMSSVPSEKAEPPAEPASSFEGSAAHLPVTPLAEAPEPPAGPAPEPAVPPCSELVIDDRSELAVGATVVRFGDGSRTSMDQGDQGPILQVDEGWCWVTVRGAGPRVPVRIQLPNGDLVVVAGGRALALVEADRSSFVVIVDGSAELLHPGANVALGPGAMVLLPAEGEPQVDRAEPDEVASDPLVAQNLAMDAVR